MIDTLKRSNTTESPFLKKPIDFYKSCHNTTQLKRLGVDPILDVVRKVRQLYPSSETGFSRSYRLSSTLAYLHSLGTLIRFVSITILMTFLGIPALFEARIEADLGENPDTLVPRFLQPKAGVLAIDEVCY